MFLWEPFPRGSYTSRASGCALSRSKAPLIFSLYKPPVLVVGPFNPVVPDRDGLAVDRGRERKLGAVLDRRLGPRLWCARLADVAVVEARFAAAVFRGRARRQHGDGEQLAVAPFMAGR